MVKIETQHAPKVVGPYSQAVVAGEFVFCSGQIGINPLTGELVSADIQEQTKQVLENLQQVLHAADSSIDLIVTTEVYLKDINDYAVMNEVYGRVFKNNLQPARTTVAVSALPKNALVEMSCVACKKHEK
jgi:2-iminobutanoate/2-iminopropanoate deaminase